MRHGAWGMGHEAVAGSVNSSPSSVIERKLLFLHILSMIENIYKRQAGQPPSVCVPLPSLCFANRHSIPLPLPLLPPSAFQIFNKAPTRQV